MKTKLIQSDNQYFAEIPQEFIEKLNLQDSGCLEIDFNLELNRIIIGCPDIQNIQDIEADEDF